MSDELSEDISWLLQRFIVNWPEINEGIFSDVVNAYHTELGQTGIWAEIENQLKQLLSLYNSSNHCKNISEDVMMTKCYERLKFWYNNYPLIQRQSI